MRQGPYEEVIREPRPTGWKAESHANTRHAEMQQCPRPKGT